MPVLVGQMQNHEPLSWDVEHRNPHEVVKDPPYCRMWTTVPFWVWEGRSVLLQDRADAVFEGRIDEQTHRHDHQQGHDALGFLRESEEAQNCGSLRKRSLHSMYH